MIFQFQHIKWTMIEWNDEQKVDIWNFIHVKNECSLNMYRIDSNIITDYKSV